MPIYSEMDHKTLEREYSPSSCIDDIMIYIQQYSDESKMARVLLKNNLKSNVKYGPEERSNMDVFIPEGDGPFPIHIFIHGGYWQELSIKESSFAAPNFIGHDITFIALDYTLAPEATLFEIVEQVRSGVVSIVKKADQFSGDITNITLSGSSAGAHLVAEILSTDWHQYGIDHFPIKGALCVSGIYDLVPLVNTYVNEPLKMTEEDAYKLSPINHIPDLACPLILSYGENETSEFKRQTHEFADAWQQHGHYFSYIDMPKFNHFDIIMELNNRESPLFKSIYNIISA
jgi:arylformamidase